MRRIMLVVAYDGTEYAGWQVQPKKPTVESELNSAISQLTGEPCSVIGASRTDSGVHALGNVAVFDTESRIPAEKFAYALNQWLPKDIVIQQSVEVPRDFHPRHCDSTKTYEYRILNRTFLLPEYRNTAHFYYGELDVDSMRNAAAAFVGEHDFAGFCSSGSQVRTTVRTIYQLDIREEQLACHGGVVLSDRPNRMIIIRVVGNGFLYNMVRIIAGTLIEVGRGSIPADTLPEIIASCDRQRAGATAPARGLCLTGIQFNDRLK